MDLLKKIPFKKYWWLGVLILVLLGGVTVFFIVRFGNTSRNSPSTSNNTATSSAQPESGGAQNPNSLDPLEKGRALANGKCSGEGSRKLSSAPMKTDQISY